MTKRKRLIVKHTLIGLGVVIACSALVLYSSRHKPYVPGEEVEGITQGLTRQLPDGCPKVQFVDVAEQAGIRFRHFQGTRTTQLPEDMGSGAAWGDYDNDGYPDLYVVDIAGPLTATAEELARSPGGNRLYHNNRNGTFTDVTEHAGAGLKAIGMGAAWADFDNDGLPDLVVTTFGPIVLYHNRGDGTFEDVSSKSGLASFQGFWSGASWADYDRDGFPDLYICGYVQYKFRPEDMNRKNSQFNAVVPFTLNPSSYRPERNLLFHNNHNGTFTEVAVAAGVDNPTGRSLSAAWADFDGDGWADLYVANDVSDNALYINLHNGRFKDVSASSWAADYRGAMGLAVGDWDRDGDTDMYVTHWMAQENALFSNLRFNRGLPSAKSRELHFQDEADMMGLGQISLSVISWGTSFFDYDNDGQADLLVVNGSTFQDDKNPKLLAPMKNMLFWQKSPDEGYFETGAVSGRAFSELHVGRGAAFADYDNDGAMDVFVVNNQGRAQLLRNTGRTGNNWLKVRVQCSKSNRSGFGARVEVAAGGGSQSEEIGSQSSYLSQNFNQAHFGLKNHAAADRVSVRFPSGVVREMTGVKANQTITIREDQP